MRKASSRLRNCPNGGKPIFIPPSSEVKPSPVIRDDVKQKIFEHLFTTKAVGKGTGLGLAIADQIVVERHHGALAVNSTLGEGTEFVITLPVKGG